MGTAIGVLGCVLLSRRDHALAQPLVLGLGAGACLAAAEMTARILVFALTSTIAYAAAAMLVVVYGAAAVLVRTFRGVPSWILARLTFSLTMAGIGAAGHVLVVAPEYTVLIDLAQAASLLAVASLALDIIRSSTLHGDAELAELRGSLERAELAARRDRRRLHEIDSTVAGIVSAQRLLHDHPGLSQERSRSLADMITAEVGRLERIVQDAAPEPWCSLDLDHLVDSLALSQQARGRVVSTTRSGVRAMGRADHVSEVVNILLENAAKHGLGDAVSVNIRQVGDTAQISVSDSGPGVSPAVRSSLFDWGVRGPDSHGQGIGLHAARQLMADQGGSLHHVDTGRGATFVVGLQLATVDHDAAMSNI